MPNLVHVLQVHQRSPATTTEPREKRMRLNDAEFDEVSDEFHQWREARANQGQQRSLKRESSKRRMEVFLVYLARGGFFPQAGFPQGIAESTAWLYCQEAADFFAEISAAYIQLPTPAELPALGVPLLGQQAVLFLDGLIQAIQRPANVGDAFYCGRRGKACDGLNIQVLSDRNGLVRHIVAGVPGSTHDLVAIQQSPWFMNWLQRLPAPYAVVGDIAYMGLGPNVITPHRRPPRGTLTPQQRQENGLISSVRIMAERVNGAIEVKWRAIQSKENRLAALRGPEFASKCMIASPTTSN